MIPVGVEHSALLYLALAVGVIGSAARYFYFRENQFFSWLRIFILSVLLFTLSRPYGSKDEEQKESLNVPVRILVDISESMSVDVVEKELQAVTEELSRLGRGYEIVPFAGGVGAGVQSVRGALNQGGRLEISQTSLGAALEQTLDSPSRDIVLITDGVETTGSARSIISLLMENGNRLYPRIRKDLRKSQQEVVLENLVLPLHREKGAVVEGSVTFSSRSQSKEAGTLVLTMNGEIILEEKMVLRPGENQIRTFSLPSTSQEQDKVEVRFSPDGEGKSVLSRTWYLHTKSGEHLLLLSRNDIESRYLKTLFERMSIEVDTTLQAGQMSSLSKYQAVLLNNVLYKDIPSAVRREVAEYVRAGGHLIVVGGENSFGLGGYVGTEIDSLLPVESLIPRKEIKRVNVAVQLVLDKSSSMKYGQKIEFSKVAAREVVRNLKDGDYFGVIGFDTTPFIAFPLRRLAEYRNMAISRIATLYAAGKTNLYPALDEARRGLVNIPAGRKHAIVLTDGRIPDGGPQYLQLVQQMRMKGITVSTVMMGADVDTSLLRSMAQYGGGSFYQTSDASALPRIFLSDVQVSMREDTMKESKEYSVRRRTDRAEKDFSISLTEYPSVAGYVSTKARRPEYVELLVTGSGKAEPLLATRRLGMGKTVAFTTDMSGRWSSKWVSWGSLQQFWRELLFPDKESIEQGSADEPDYDFRWYFDGADLVLDTILFEENEQLRSLLITEGSGVTQEFVPERVAEGRYQVRVSKEVWSTSPLTVSGTTEEKQFGPITIQLGGDVRDEMRPDSVQIELLNELARRTGGAVNTLPDDQWLAGKKAKRGVVRRDYTEPFLFFVFLCLLIDIIRRAIPSRRLSPRQNLLLRNKRVYR